ncbi:MAG: envelope stress response membrane protein PspB [Gammaproteobacteria bacterium]|jgi:phage shock protein B|nr:envelope stress response membrane protein PspB [Gammaproteobacteria bacterium]|tara:strand:- start:417 stop:659 length:243 start_codon:yes stop_codon:yes gene_type:complete
MDISTFIFVPVVIFMGLVAPIWIVFHYRSKASVVDGLSAGERADLDEMIETANRMAARIETLESILDVESPGWREKQAQV